MKYHEFVPDPDAIAARIEGHVGAADAPPPGSGSHAVAGALRAQATEVPATLAGLTALRDRVFVTAAYRLLLGRDPDRAGDDFLESLRSGAIDKVDVLGGLRYSAEGRQRAIEISGLASRYTRRRIGRIPGIGWVVRWLEAVLRLPALTRDVRRQQAAIELASVEAEAHVAAIGRIQGEVRELRALTARLATTEGMLGELFGDTRELRSRADMVETDLKGYRDELRAIEQRVEARYKRLAESIERVTIAPGGSARAADSPPSIARVDGGVSSPVHASPAPGTDATLAPRDFETFYLEFEERFRGSREETRRLQEVYLRYVETAHAGTSDAPVIDLGCGRGEWLELLRERGYASSGVDGNRVMVAENVQRGLDVAVGDVLAHLATLPDASVGMVTGFHIIEHLPFAQLVGLLDECRRVLRPGGCAIFETPNPENLVVSGYTFHLDPTHHHPLPPQLTEFLAWQRGFFDVEILRLHPRPEVGSDQALIDRWFRSATDYAVVAWKDRKGGGTQ